MSNTDSTGGKAVDGKKYCIERYCVGLGLVKGKYRLNLDKWKRIGLQTITKKVEEISNEIIMQDISFERKWGCR